jgi:HK97 family phage major capsid protein
MLPEGTSEVSAPTGPVAELNRLRARRLELRGMLDESLSQATRSGREEMRANERAMLGELRALEGRITHQEAEVARAGDPASWPGAANRQMTGGGDRCGRVALEHRASRVLPLRFKHEEMQRMHEALKRGESCSINADLEQRAFFSPDSMLPAALYPWPIQQIEHEPRLADKFAGYATEAPSIEFVQHTGTTGAAGLVAEGAAKPELVFELAQLTLPMQKIACHLGLTWEILSDWDNFVSYAHAEQFRQVIVAENNQFINGTGASGQLTGLLSTTGVLTHDAANDNQTNQTAVDSIQLAMATLRNGSALAIPDLFICSPNTWTGLKSIKDLYARYILTPDPANDAPDTLWGIEVLQTTQIADGTGILLDTTKFGQVVVREPIVMRMGFANADFTNNIVRFVAEERLNLAVVRPAAICVVTGLPT